MGYTKEQMREYMVSYRAKQRREFIQLLGGCCSKCGSKENLEFDHIDPKTKSFNISGSSRSKKEIIEELQKCQLLCSKCHSTKSVDEATQTSHGTTMYRNGCRCEDCRAAVREYRSARRTMIQYRYG